MVAAVGLGRLGGLGRLRKSLLFRRRLRHAFHRIGLNRDL